MISLLTGIYYHHYLHHRGDGSLHITYQNLEEVSAYGLTSRHVSTMSGKYRLHGYIYNLENNPFPKALILMYHGIASGSNYLFNMIHDLVKEGYEVIAFDFHASMMSEGNYIGDMTKSIKDCEAILKYIKSDSTISNLPLYVFGHSWGGYNALMTLLIDDNRVKKCVSISGFDTEYQVVNGQHPILAKFLVAKLLLNNGKYFFYSGRKALKMTDAKVLYIQGTNDKIVNPKQSGYVFEKIAKERDNIEVIFYPGRGHTPFVDPASVEKQDEILAKLGFFGNSEVSLNYHYIYNDISKNDPEVLKKILDFYNN